MAYWGLHYHIVWTTYRREALIDAVCEPLIHQTLYGKAKELGILIHAVGNVEDHIHVVAFHQNCPLPIASAGSKVRARIE